eukprot:scaffold928_cov370-Prasinococcus_capsulatus_cf.AAC.6
MRCALHSRDRDANKDGVWNMEEFTEVYMYEVLDLNDWEASDERYVRVVLCVSGKALPFQSYRDRRAQVLLLRA